MNFPEAIDYLYSRLPMFQDQGTRAYKPGLDGIENFCKHLGDPHKKFKSIHVGGTNGKGSTSHMLASVLQSAGYRVGLYTSPHLKSFTERIRVDGQEVSQEFVAEFVTTNRAFIEKHKPSFFEVTVAMGFECFVKQKIDIAVVEVGMGGRLDSTNIITPEVAIVTNIGWDHMQHLGNTLPLIATEKAGIIKPGIPVVISESVPPDIREVFEAKARQTSSALTIAADQYTFVQQRISKTGQTIKLIDHHDAIDQDFELDLAGKYQIDNLKGVLSTIRVLNQQGIPIHSQSIELGLSSVISTTGLKGRWQTLQCDPLVICDTAHNVDGLRRTVEQFEALSLHRLHFVLGFVADKDVRSILSLFPLGASYYFCQPSVQRALGVDELVAVAQHVGIVGERCQDVNDALRKAVSNASIQDGIYVGGSTFVVADLNQL